MRRSEEYNPMANKIIGKLSDPKERTARGELHFEWIAKYNDGTELKQYDDEKGLVYHFGHIDQEKVVEFIIESTKAEKKFSIGVNLRDGLFYIDSKPVKEISDGKTHIPLGLFLIDKKVVSSWGNKAKLIFVRHIRRDFNMGTGTMTATVTYELGWEATVNGKQKKHTIIVDQRGHLGLPITSEQEGFKTL
jgi:hypothetical protein